MLFLDEITSKFSVFVAMIPILTSSSCVNSFLRDSSSIGYLNILKNLTKSRFDKGSLNERVVRKDFLKSPISVYLGGWLSLSHIPIFMSKERHRIERKRYEIC